MKIINGDEVYVQKNDMIYFFRFMRMINGDYIRYNYCSLPVPVSTFSKVFGRGPVIIDDSNRYDFVKVDDKAEIEFFDGLDWILDYNQVKNMPKDELVKMGQSMLDERNEIANRFNSMSLEEKSNNGYMIDKCEMLEYKIQSLRDFIWFREGDLNMKLPSGVDYPEGYVKKPKRKGLKGFVRGLRRKSED